LSAKKKKTLVLLRKPDHSGGIGGGTPQAELVPLQKNLSSHRPDQSRNKQNWGGEKASPYQRIKGKEKEEEKGKPASKYLVGCKNLNGEARSRGKKRVGGKKTTDLLTWGRRGKKEQKGRKPSSAARFKGSKAEKRKIMNSKPCEKRRSRRTLPATTKKGDLSTTKRPINPRTA